jgi:hypothetical protein
MIHTINQALGTKALAEPVLDQIFEMWWPRLDERLTTLPPSDVQRPERTPESLLEELLTLARSQTALLQQTVTPLQALGPQLQMMIPQLQMLAPQMSQFPYLLSNLSTQMSQLSPQQFINSARELNEGVINALRLTEYRYVDEHGRPYRKQGLFFPAQPDDRRFEWHGYMPPEKRGWRYPKEQLDRLLEQGLIEFTSEKPTLREYAPPEPAPLPESSE